MKFALIASFVLTASITQAVAGEIAAPAPAKKDTSTECGEVAMDAIVRDIVKHLDKPSDIDNWNDGLLSGSADLDETKDGVSTYRVDFTGDDRYHTVYTVSVGQNCKVLAVESEGFF